MFGNGNGVDIVNLIYQFITIAMAWFNIAKF